MRTLLITLVSLLSLVPVAQADAFFAKNREKWASYWVHEPYISWTAQGGADRVLSVSGWEAYSGMFEGYFRDPTPGPPRPGHDDPARKFRGDGAGQGGNGHVPANPATR